MAGDLAINNVSFLSSHPVHLFYLPSFFMYLVIVEMKGRGKNLQSKHFSLISIIFIMHEKLPQKYLNYLVFKIKIC